MAASSKFTFVSVVKSASMMIFHVPSFTPGLPSAARARPMSAGQLVLQICRLGALSAHTRAAGAARAVRRLLALKTKHLVVHRKNPPHSVVLSIIG
jgi:hypothetical protein